jgi:hypothetical protein
MIGEFSPRSSFEGKMVLITGLRSDILGRSAIRAIQKVDERQLCNASATASCHCVLQTLPQAFVEWRRTGQTKDRREPSKPANCAAKHKGGRAGGPIAFNH